MPSYFLPNPQKKPEQNKDVPENLVQSKRVDTPEAVKSIIRVYVALFFHFGDSPESIPEKHFVVAYEAIPSDMPDERVTIRIIHYCLQNGYSVNKATVHAIAQSNGWHVPNLQFVDEMPPVWTTNKLANIRLLYSLVNRYYFETSGIGLWERAQQIMSDKTLGDYSARYKMAMKLAVQASPISEENDVISDIQLYEDALSDYEKKRDIIRETGKLPYPTPFMRPLRESGIYFPEGEYSLILGAEGTGKTSFAQQLAEWIAWQQGIWHDVLYITLETNLHKLAIRSLSRNCAIPLHDLVSYKADPKSEPFQKAYNEFISRRKTREEESGYVYYNSPSVKSADGIIDAIRQAHWVSASANRKLFIIVDHIGRIEFERLRGSNDANMITDSVVRIANACRSLNSHVTFLGHVDNNGMNTLFGATQVVKNAQLVLVIEADKPQNGVQSDWQVFDVSGVPMLDYIGRPRFFQRMGDSHSANVKITIQKSNDTAGGTFACVVERPMANLFYDNVPQNTPQPTVRTVNLQGV